MRQMRILIVVFVTASVVSAIVVTAASAVEFLLALWLSGGSVITALLPVENEGEQELVSLNGGGFGIHVKVLCSFVLRGWVSSESLGFMSEILTLGGEAIPLTELTGSALLCTNDENCTEPEVWAAGLGWETEAELMVDGAEVFFVNLRFKSPWYIQCLSLGITISETCSWSFVVEKLTNEANGTVDEELNDEFHSLAGGVLGECSIGGKEAAELKGLQIILEVGTSLSVSSE